MSSLLLQLLLLCGHGSSPYSTPFSCGCIRRAPPPSARQQAKSGLKGAAAVLLGQVTSITDISPTQDSGGSIWASRKVVVRVDSLWKGAATDSLVIWTGFGGGDCGFPFQVGRSYLIFAVSDDSNRLKTWECSLTQDRAGADDVIGALGPPAFRRSSGGSSSP